MSNQNNGVVGGLVKTVSALTSLATLLTLTGAAYLAPLSASAAVPADYGLKEGDTISAANTNDPDVYIVNAYGYKRLFLNPVIFNFYGHLGGFAKVKTVSAAARDAFPTSGLFRNCETNAQQVWAVEVTGEDTGTLHPVNMSGDAAVAQDANFFKKVFCINNNEANWYTKSSVAYTSLSQIPVYTRSGTPSTSGTPAPVNNGPVQASLAADTPASGTVLAGQSVADLARFTLSNPTSSAVNVNTLTFQRLGISGDTTFSNVYVFQQTPGTSLYATRLTDSANPSAGVITFGSGTATSYIAQIPANSSINIAVRVDVAANTTGQTMGVGLTSVNGMAVSGVNGNIFTVAAAPSNLAGAAWQTGSIIPSTSSINPQNGMVVWQDTLSVTNNNLSLRRLSLREIGSVNPATDVQNFRLMIDGNQVAQVQNLDANSFATFVLPSPYLLTTGTRTITVLADVVGGTNKSFTMSLRGNYDIGLVDTNYNVNVGSTATPGSFPLTTGTISVLSGSIVTVKDSSSPSGNVVKAASDQVLGRWDVTAYGEPVKVSNFIIGLRLTNGSGSGFVAGTASLRNGRVMIYPQGSSPTQSGSTTSLLYSNTASTSYTVNYTFNPGTTYVVEARADMYDNGDSAGDLTQANSTVTAQLYTGSSNGQGMSSLSTSNVPGAPSPANTLTIQTGTTSLNSYAGYPNQNIVTPQSSQLLSDWVLTGSTTEPVNVTTLTVGIGGTAPVANLTNVYLKYNGVSQPVKATVSASNNTWSVSGVQLPVNGSVHVQLYATVASTTGALTFIPTLQVNATGANSGVSANTGTSNGQTITVGTGSIASSLAGTNPNKALVAAGQTIDVAKFNLVATNDSYNITEVQFKTIASKSESGITGVYLKNADTGAILAGPLPLSTNGNSQFVTFGSLNGLVVPANNPNGLNLTAAVTTNNVGVNAASTGLNIGLALNYYKNVSQSTGTLATDSTVRTGNAFYLHNAIPVITTVNGGSGIQNGTVSLIKFNVAASGPANSTIAWNKILVTISKTSGPNIASGSSFANYRLYEDGADITSNVTFAQTANGCANGYTGCTLSITVNSNADRLVGTTGHTYDLQNTAVTNVGATANVTDSATAAIGAPSAQAQPNTQAIVNATTASFVWSDRAGNTNTGTVHSNTTTDWMNDFLVKNLPISELVTPAGTR